MRNISDKHRIVIKLGTSTLAHKTGKLNIRRMTNLVRVISDLHNSGREIIIVSSGAVGLGAGKLRTIFKIILPSAVPGILSGVILAIGRIVGESAALIFTAGTVADTATSLMSSSRTLSVHLYCLLTEGLYTKQAYATAVVLLLLVLIINGISNFAAKKIAKA